MGLDRDTARELNLDPDDGWSPYTGYATINNLARMHQQDQAGGFDEDGWNPHDGYASAGLIARVRKLFKRGR